MVQMRRIRRGEEVDESDQTAEVIENMDTKIVPEIQQHAPVPPVQNAPLPPQGAGVATPALPPTGLQRDGLWNNGTIMVTNIYKIASEHLRYSDEWRRFNGHIAREVGESVNQLNMPILETSLVISRWTNRLLSQLNEHTNELLTTWRALAT